MRPATDHHLQNSKHPLSHFSLSILSHQSHVQTSQPLRPRDHSSDRSATHSTAPIQATHRRSTKALVYAIALQRERHHRNKVLESRHQIRNILYRVLFHQIRSPSAYLISASLLKSSETATTKEIRTKLVCNLRFVRATQEDPVLEKRISLMTSRTRWMCWR